MLLRKISLFLFVWVFATFCSTLVAAEKTILLIMTSYSGELAPGHPTGYWAEEFVIPCRIFLDSGFSVSVSTVQGKVPVADPASLNDEMTRMIKSDDLSKILKETISLSDVDPGEYDGIFIVGGHGVLWDLVYDNNVDRIVNQILLCPEKVVSAVCHGPAALVHVKDFNGKSILMDRKVTGFSLTEELGANLYQAVKDSPLQGQLATWLDFLSKGNYSCASDWQPYVVQDGNLITGQNPSSSKDTALAVVKFFQAAEKR